MVQRTLGWQCHSVKTLFLGLSLFAGTVQAHHPNRETQEPHQRIDVIGPLGNRLPPSYRRKYNRPTYLGGKIAYHIAPSSQEAMAWHRAVHLNAYKNHTRIENLYFFPKPWEALKVGPRVSVLEPQKADLNAQSSVSEDDGLIEALTPPVYSESYRGPVENVDPGNAVAEPASPITESE